MLHFAAHPLKRCRSGTLAPEGMAVQMEEGGTAVFRRFIQEFSRCSA
jgi:hypothetical protein